jgi:16S rRNA (uracil1498-N3)-methyltransferase
MKRFLVTENLAVGARIRFSPEETKHAIRVMRLGPGSKVLLTDGKGLEAEAELLDAEKSGALLEILTLRKAGERSYRVTLLQAVLKGPRMDWLVEKATELGVDAIHMVDSQFSVAGERAERWARLAQAAMKQSGNLRMPELRMASGLADALDRLPAGYRGFLLSPTAEKGLAEAIKGAVAKNSGLVVLAIGPEGGFSAEEESLLESRGFQACRLSAQILRGETAALAAACIALHTLEFSHAPELS